MPARSTISFDFQVFLASATMFSSFALVLFYIAGSAGMLGTLASVTGMFSGLFLFRQLWEKKQQSATRQHVVQMYLDRLLLAETPEERQPILEEMAAQQFLKGAFMPSSDLESLDLSFADFSRADLSGATLSSANLVGTSFAHATLSYASFSYTGLHGAILTGAHLRGVNFHGADLRQTDMSQAMLRGANLVDASLLGADLRDSQLHGANLRNADLLNANLSGAILDRAIMPDGTQWHPGMDLNRFTNPAHVGFWQPVSMYSQPINSVNNVPPRHFDNA